VAGFGRLVDDLSSGKKERKTERKTERKKEGKKGEASRMRFARGKKGRHLVAYYFELFLYTISSPISNRIYYHSTSQAKQLDFYSHLSTIQPPHPPEK
jgi:hypothetical protein